MSTGLRGGIVPHLDSRSSARPATFPPTKTQANLSAGEVKLGRSNTASEMRGRGS
jgi:hypothetical protein